MLIERRLGLQVRKKRVHTGVHSQCLEFDTQDTGPAYNTDAVHMSQVRRTSPVGYKYMP